MAPPGGTVYPLMFSVVANFGRVLAIGSERFGRFDYGRRSEVRLLLPVIWHREPLSWTQQSQRLVTTNRVGSRVLGHWKFRSGAGNGFCREKT